MLKRKHNKDLSTSPREFRRKRLRTDSITNKPEWIESKHIDASNIKTLQDLIIFIHNYNGLDTNMLKLKNTIDPLLELNNMIGLTKLKSSIIDMVMHFAQGRHRKNTDYLHMVVCGPPGCGKTSVCKIIGKILSKIGILPKETFTIVKRTDFIGKYLGQTSHKTEAILNKCKGGIMFIDEAYSLAPRNTDNDQYSKEALDFLNQFLSEHKDDLVCIIAGYEDELNNTFFAMNDGLKRRFPWKFIIDPYSPNELVEIFNKMLKDVDYKIKEPLKPEFFTVNKDYFTFAGGDIETFITKCKFIHTRNTFGKQVDNVLTEKDINDGLEQHKSHKLIIKNTLPENLYL
jgi:SpoVK/Ycf46/Vps4 family AAA+-type ATPase